MKNSSDTVGNVTRDLRACNALPQPTGPLRAPGINRGTRYKNYLSLREYKKMDLKKKIPWGFEDPILLKKGRSGGIL